MLLIGVETFFSMSIARIDLVGDACFLLFPILYFMRDFVLFLIICDTFNRTRAKYQYSGPLSL